MAKKEKETKTNAMRILERLDIPFTLHEYEVSETGGAAGFTNGADVAAKQGLPPEQVFKTLVTIGADGGHYVFVIPVGEELDLKKCAKSVGVKNVQMLPMKELFELTGYVRGGCTAIGMKKQFPTRIDETAQLFETIHVSGGRIGSGIELAPGDFLAAAEAEYADLVKD
ncbi:MAG: Cys-tRNA(Pro) deacylase [Lachnospiraceae bacterium]|nr:Cys-tRNA(Pro) deacylase [Lachnospiraceae bacterium]